MKKALLLILSGLLALFLLITFLKDRSSKVSSLNDTPKVDLVDKNRIQRFWQVYRQATEHRIAGRLHQAIEEYENALELDEQHENTLYYLGSLYFKSGEFRKAEGLWQQLVQINPYSARAHSQLGTLYLTSNQKEFFDLKSAKIEFQKAMELNKEETGPPLQLGQIALIQKDLSEASRYFEAVFGSHYKSVEAYFLNGYIAWKQEDSQKALALFTKSIKYSKPEKPLKGILGEGDTKTGESFGESNNQNLFQMQMEGLEVLDELKLAQEMDNRYQQLESSLEQIRKKSLVK